MRLTLGQLRALISEALSPEEIATLDSMPTYPPSKNTIINPFPTPKGKLCFADMLPRAIQTDRVYAALKTPEKINKLPLIPIPFNLLRSFQGSVRRQGVEAVLNGSNDWNAGTYPIAIKVKDVYVLHDGTHRAVAAMVSGETSVVCRVIDSKKYLNR